MFPAGIVQLPTWGGIQFELDQERPVISWARISQASATTTDELVAALVDHVGVELTPIGDVVTAIGPALGYEFTYDEVYSTPEQANALPFLFENSDWIRLPDNPLGEIWIIDTEGGPSMVRMSGMSHDRF